MSLPIEPHRAALHLGESLGWIGAAIGLVGAPIAAITPDGIQPWLVLLGGMIAGGTSGGIALYFAVLKARLEGETLEAIARANIADIEAGRPPRFPQFLPKGPAPK